MQTINDHIRSRTGVSLLTERAILWPPDAFAIAGLLLQDTGAYRCAISDNSWRRNENISIEKLRRKARQWRLAAADNLPPPDPIYSIWNTIRRYCRKPIAAVHSSMTLRRALFDLLAASDEASAGLSGMLAADKFHMQALRTLTQRGNSLCRSVSSSSVAVLPKIHTPQVGLTFRSLSHHLALVIGSEALPQWFGLPSTAMLSGQDPCELNLLICPFPFTIDPKCFAAMPNVTRCGRCLLPPEYGFFQYTPPEDNGQLSLLLRNTLQASKQQCRIHGVILPEASVRSWDSYTEAYNLVREEFPEAFFLAGVSELEADGMSSNRACCTIPLGNDLACYISQTKHHRWQVDSSQIDRYKLAAYLDKGRRWWEASQINDRKLTFFCIREWITCCCLICEDLARQEPVAPLIRTIGPSLVIALLLDGPQLASRWPGRYAGILADDPGSAVLTVTSLGMCLLDTLPQSHVSRTVALWRDKRQTRELRLPKGATGLILRLRRERGTEFSADGRCNANAIDLNLDSGGVLYV